MKVYKFHCPMCGLDSGFMSYDRNASPTCCHGEHMIPIKITYLDMKREYEIDWDAYDKIGRETDGGR